jgi:hypothetical protein
MKDVNSFLTLLRYEKNTLLKGWLVSFLLIFPFSFMPVLVKGDWRMQVFIDALPSTLLFAGLFSLFIVSVAVVKNFVSLKKTKGIFTKPAFKNLGFHDRFLGVGSIVKDLEVVLVGKHKAYFFLVRIIQLEKEKLTVEIIPLIELAETPEKKEKLIKDYQFFHSSYPMLSQFFKYKFSDLDSEDLLLNPLISMEKILRHLAIDPIDINEIDLFD